jgi:hypothetical protein
MPAAADAIQLSEARKLLAVAGYMLPAQLHAEAAERQPVDAAEIGRGRWPERKLAEIDVPSLGSGGKPEYEARLARRSVEGEVLREAERLAGRDRHLGHADVEWIADIAADTADLPAVREQRIERAVGATTGLFEVRRGHMVGREQVVLAAIRHEDAASDRGRPAVPIGFDDGGSVGIDVPCQEFDRIINISSDYLGY